MKGDKHYSCETNWVKHRKIQHQEQSELSTLQSGLANFEVEKISINVSIKKNQQTMLKKDNKK